MILADEILVSDDLLTKHFVCDVEKCKGACCVEGDLGAPLELDELRELDKIFEIIKPYLSAEGIKAIEKQGRYIFDREGEYSTPTINHKECAYAIYNEAGVLKCGIEMAYNDGKIDFRKPISCHLYPARLSVVGNSLAVNYHQWQICNAACELGEHLKMPLYKFLKDALIRKFGLEWYEEFERIADDYAAQ